MTGDRGLAGAFNANVLRAARDRAASWSCQGEQRAGASRVGRKGIGTLASAAADRARAGRGSATTRATRTRSTSPSYVIDQYVAGEMDRVRPRLQPLQVGDGAELMDDVPARSSARRSRDARAAPQARSRTSSSRRRSDLREAAAGLRGDRRLPRPAGVERQRAGRAHDGHAQRQRQRGGDDRRRSRWRSTAPARRPSRRRSSKSWPAPMPSA